MADKAKCIISGRLLYVALNQMFAEIKNTIELDSMFVISIKEGDLNFGPLCSIACEHKAESEMEVTLYQIRNLKNILAAITDQPIVLTIGYNGSWIGIESIVI